LNWLSLERDSQDYWHSAKCLRLTTIPQPPPMKQLILRIKLKAGTLKWRIRYKLGKWHPQAVYYSLRSEFSKFMTLWKVTPADCRLALLEEFLFNPPEFQNRYNQEIQFKRNLERGWR